MARLPNQAEIAELPWGEGAQRLEIVGVPARHDHDVRVRRESGSWNPGGDIVDDDLRGVREPLGIGELLAVVHHVDAEADLFRDSREVKADVAGADDVELGRWFNRLDVDVHLAAADQAGLLREVVGELVVDEAAGLRGLRIASRRLAERVVLVAPAADGPHVRPSPKTSIFAPTR